MLNKLKGLFAKEEKITVKEENDELSLFENPNFITDRDRIIAILSDIETSSPLCTIKIDDVPEEYNSSILGLKADKDLVVLDELIPKDGNVALQNIKSLKLSTFHKGIHLSLNLSEVEVGYSNGLIYYKAPLPERIFYPQRRRSPRIEISSIDIAFSGVSERTGISVSGYLFDLSRGGAGIDLPANRARIQRGDSIKNCQIKFDDYTMDFDFSVRFVKQGGVNTSKVQIGGFYENLSKKSRTKLSYFIASLEREEIRKQKA
ncbi:flagellar brake protein [Methylomonas sp. MgM2]